MLTATTSARRIGLVLVLAGIAAGLPAGAAKAQLRQTTDAAALIQDTAEGDLAPIEAALATAADPASKALLTAQLAASRLDARGVSTALAAYDATHDTDDARKAVALGLRASIVFAAGDYAGAAAALREAVPLLSTLGRTKESQEASQTLSLAMALATAPRQALEGGAPETAPALVDKVGLLRAPVTINGTVQQAVLDTGANLSVVSATTAKKLGLHLLDATASVGSTGSASVPTRLAIADRLTISGMTLRNVAFLVMDDAALSFPVPGGYTIDAIIGFPVFRALGRSTFRSDGFTPGGRAAPAPANLRAVGNDLFVVSRINGIAVPLHLDSGASQTALTSRFAEAHSELVANLPRGERNMAGAGGAIRQPIGWWRPAEVAIDGRSMTLDQVQVVLSAGPAKHDTKLGTLGQDVLRHFQWWAVDLAAMRFELGPPIAP